MDLECWASVGAAAAAEANASPLPGSNDGLANAYRHIIGSAELRRRFGFPTAWAIVDGDEVIGIQIKHHPDAGRRIDDRHNAIGLSTGAEAKSYDDVARRARAAIDGGIAQGGTGLEAAPLWLPRGWSEQPLRPILERRLPVAWPDTIPSAADYRFGEERFSADRARRAGTPRQREAALLERQEGTPTAEWSEADVKGVIGSTPYRNPAAPGHAAWRGRVGRYHAERSQDSDRDCGGVADVQVHTRIGPLGLRRRERPYPRHSRRLTLGAGRAALAPPPPKRLAAPDTAEGTRMEFGIAMATDAAAWKLTARAEELGFRTAWFYDTQMLSADCFVAMGAAAVKTSRIRLGTGVLIPSNRIAAVTANAFATLNKLAPGRVDIGIGTGFTGRRAMGLGAMKLKDFEEYIRVMLALLAEETVETEIEGARHKIRLLNPDLGLIDTRTPMRLHLAAAGPRARALTARLGAGWINFFSDVPAAVAMLGEMQQAWAAAGQAKALEATAFVLGCVLEEGEPCDSPRAMAQAGPRAAVLLHRAADEVLSGLPNISPVPEQCRAAVAGYVALARTFEPKDAPYLNNHRGHLMFVKPEEKPFVTAEMIRISSFTATEAELKRRVGDLRDAGYTEFTVQIVPGQEAAIEDWGRIMRAFAR